MNRFDDLIGNENVKSQLKTLLKGNKVPSTMLFEGPAGVGKKLFAKAFALEMLNISKHNPIDFIQISPDEKSGMHTIDQIRDLIKHIDLLPHEALLKYYVIENIEAMLPIHANALLKTLEEPPLHAKIILTTDSKDDVLDTILSRCVIFSFKYIKEEDLFTFLRKQKHFDDIGARKTAIALQGSLQHLNFYMNEKLKGMEELIRKMLKTYFSGYISRAFSVLEEIDHLMQKQKDGDYDLCVKLLLDYIIFWYRDVLLVQYGKEEKIFFKEELEFLKELKDFKLLSLDKLSVAAMHAKEALLRNIKVKNIVENFLLTTPQMMDVTA